MRCDPSQDQPSRARTDGVTETFGVDGRTAKHGVLLETSVQLDRITPCHFRTSSAVPDFAESDYLFIGTTLPMRGLDGSVFRGPVGPFIVEGVVNHERRQGKPSIANFQYSFWCECRVTRLRRVRLVDYDDMSD